MMREVIATGKTVEEARENGLRELGVELEEASVEVLDMPVRKLFKNTPARVRVTVGEPDAPEAAAAPAPAPAEAAPKTAAAPKAEAGEKAPAPAAQTAKPKATAVLPEEPAVPIDLDANPHAAMAVNFLKEIFDAMGATGYTVEAMQQGEATLLRVEGGDIQDKMEIRGETIQALSYLIDRSVNTGVDKKEQGYLRIRLDIAGFRNRREKELIDLATRTAAEVAKTGRSRTLAPMNPYERLIVHTAISAMDGVMSESIGADVERRVVVKSTGPNATDGEDWRPPRRGGNGGGRDGGNRGGGRRDDRRGGGRNRDSRGGRGGDRRSGGSGYGGSSSGGYGGGRPGGRDTGTPQREYADKERDPNAAPVVPKPREAIRDGDDMPLYGKIEL